MIVKIIKGGTFSGTGNYVYYKTEHGVREAAGELARERGLGGPTPDIVDEVRAQIRAGRVAWAECHYLPTAEPDVAVRMMEATAALNERVSAPAYHFVVSWKEGENVPVETQKQVARQTLERMGMTGLEAVAVGHMDTEKPHFHVLVNRIDPETGKAWSKHNDARRFSKVMHGLEKEHNFAVVKGRSKGPVLELGRDDQAPLTEGERAEAIRGHLPFRDVVRAAHGAHLEEFVLTKDLPILRQRLAGDGLKVEPFGGGHRIVDEAGEYVNLSKISRLAAREMNVQKENGYGRGIERETAGAARAFGAENRGAERGGIGVGAGPDRGADRGGGQRADEGRGPAAAGADHPGASRAERARGGGSGRPGGDEPDRQDDRRGAAGPERGPAPDAARDREVAARPGDGPGRGVPGRDGVGHSPFADPAVERVAADLRVLQERDHLDSGRDRSVAAVNAAERELKPIQAVSERFQASARFLDDRLGALYRDPVQARHNFEQAAARGDWSEATETLREWPEEYGELRGRSVAGFPNTERTEALKAAPGAEQAAGDFLRNRASVEAAGPQMREAEARVRQAQAEVARIERELAKWEPRMLLMERAGRAVQPLNAEQRGMLGQQGLAGLAEQALRQSQSPQQQHGQERGMSR